MDSSPAPKKRNESGIALMLVLSVVTVLAMLVTEFTYISQVNQRMAYDRLDSIRVHYLAKSALKLSLLRLKAYKTLKGFASSGQGSKIPIPKQMLEQIWSFPLIFPLPALPGMSSSDKDRIKKFQDESGLDGEFSAKIESESSKYNLNLLFAEFVPQEKTKKDDEKKSTDNSNASNSSDTSTASTEKKEEEKSTGFDPKSARESLALYINQILDNKFEADEDFAEEYRDLDREQLISQIIAWADLTFEIPNSLYDTEVTVKRAPFYSLTELHMIPLMDDRLYDILAPTLTVSTTPGINVNTMSQETLLALLPDLTEEDVEDFFERRDNPEEGGKFVSEDDFYKYLGENISLFTGNTQSIEDFKNTLKQRNIRLVTEETTFKITIQAQVNNSTKLLEAWVTLDDVVDQTKKTTTTTTSKQNTSNSGTKPGQLVGAGKNTSGAGIRITFLRTT